MTSYLVLARRSGAAGIVLAAAAALYGAHPALAQNKQWVGPDNSWWDFSSNWSPAGQPQHGDNAFVTFTASGTTQQRIVNYWNTAHPTAVLGLVRIQGHNTSGLFATMILQHNSAHNLRASEMQIGFNTDMWGRYDQSAGLAEFGLLTLGFNAGSVGTWNLSGGSANITGSTGLVIGHDGLGTLNQTGGTLTTTNTRIGRFTGSSGSLTVSGASTIWNNSGTVSVAGLPTGAGGSGSLTVNNSARATIGDELRIWNNGTATLAGANSHLRARNLTIIGGTFTRNAGSLVVSSASSGIFPFFDIGQGGGTGTVSISAGGVLNNNAGNVFLGVDSGSTGSLSVSGTGSAMHNPGGMVIGYDASGIVNINSGGLITTGSADIGFSVLSSGFAAVTGAGSRLSASGAVNVGGSNTSAGGPGTLNVSNAASADIAGTLRIWNSGQVNLSGTDAHLRAASLSITGGTLTRSAGTGLLISNTVSNTWSFFEIGQGSGTGTLSISAGGTLNNTGSAYLGASSAATGNATVTGLNSVWNNTGGNLFVGEVGAGNLTISNGGRLSNDSGFIGLVGSASGTATVSGASSRWNNSGSLYVGGSSVSAGGSGTLNISNEGRVNVGGTLRVWGPGAVNITTSNTGIAALGLQITGGVVNQPSGATLIINSSPEFAPLIGGTIIGESGTPVSASITAGGTLNSHMSSIGRNTGGMGSVTVSGAGSAWNETINISIGGLGTGDLTVQAGGSVTTHFANIPLAQTGVGALTVAGGGSNFNADSIYMGGFDGAPGAGSVYVDNGGRVSVADTFRLRGAAFVGLSGANSRITTAVLDVQAGIFERAAGTALIVSSAVGTPGNFFEIGRAGGHGTLTITGGSLNNTGDAYLAVSGSSTANALVSGSSAVWQNVSAGAGSLDAGRLYVGHSGSAALTIAAGGHVSNTNGYLGFVGAAASGEVSVSGGGSWWENTDSLFVGGGPSFAGGNGVIDIESGGRVTVAGSARVWGGGQINLTGTSSRFTASALELFGGQFTRGENTSVVISSSITSIPGNYFDIGADGGLGSVNVLGGGVLNNADDVFIGFGSGGSVGMLLVSGEDSAFYNSEWMFLGDGGTGYLNVHDGGVVGTAGAMVGLFGGTGTATISDGGHWLTGELIVGGTASSASGTGTVNVDTAGTLAIGAQMLVWDDGVVNYSGGTLSPFAIDLRGGGRVLLSSGSDKVLETSYLSINLPGGSHIDLSDNEMIVHVTPPADVHAYVASGYAGGDWDGPGINSSAAAGQSGRAIGVAPLGTGTRVAFTWAGDATLDGQVTIADLSVLASNWQRGVSDGLVAYWSHGDFNFDGQVTIADLSILANNWQAGVAAGAPMMSFAEALAMFDVFNGVVIPEPSAVGLLGIAGMLALRRRR